MGERRFFHVESKSFELARHDSGICITERGKNHTSNLMMGVVIEKWCQDALLDLAQSIDQNAFRSFHEGNKVFVIQKQMNNKRLFVSLTVLGDSRGKGNVIILDGKETRGWRGFSHELDGILFLAALEKAVAKVNSDSHWRPAMNHGDSVG